MTTQQMTLKIKVRPCMNIFTKGVMYEITSIESDENGPWDQYNRPEEWLRVLMEYNESVFHICFKHHELNQELFVNLINRIFVFNMSYPYAKVYRHHEVFRFGTEITVELLGHMHIDSAVYTEAAFQCDEHLISSIEERKMKT